MEEALHSFRNDITKGSVTLPFPLVIQAVFLAEVSDSNNGRAHGSMQGLNTVLKPSCRVDAITSLGFWVSAASSTMSSIDLAEV